MYRLSGQCISSLDKTYRAGEKCGMTLNDYEVINITGKPKNTRKTLRKSQMRYEKHVCNSKREVADHCKALAFY